MFNLIKVKSAMIFLSSPYPKYSKDGLSLSAGHKSMVQETCQNELDGRCRI